MAPNPSETTQQFYTIPKLAERIGVSAQAIRNWIDEGKIEPPPEIPVTEERAYSAEAAERIEQDYMRRAADGGTRGPGAEGRRDGAEEYLDQHDLPTNPTPAQIVLEEVHRWLELADDFLPVVVLTSIIANLDREADPVWMMIVAPPSSGKTELIRAVEELPGVHALGKLTGRTFVSGMMGDDRSLLTWLSDKDKWLLTHKDWGTVMALNPQERNQVLAQLRQIYDGKFDASYGTGVKVNWRGKLGFLVGATPAVDHLQKWSTELGERFVQFRPAAPDEQRVTIKASLNKGREDEMRSAIDAAYAKAVDEAARIGDEDHVHAPEGDLVAGALARLVAKARTSIRHDRYGGGFQASAPEGPARLTGIFTQIYRAAHVGYGCDHEAATSLLVRVGFDSITPGIRRKLIVRLAGSEDGLAVKGLGKSLRCDDNTARRHLDDLVALGLAESKQPAKTKIYTASPHLADLVAQVFLDEFEPEKALEILALLYTQHTHEGEEKEE